MKKQKKGKHIVSLEDFMKQAQSLEVPSRQEIEKGLKKSKDPQAKDALKAMKKGRI